MTPRQRAFSPVAGPLRVPTAGRGYIIFRGKSPRATRCGETPRLCNWPIVGQSGGACLLHGFTLVELLIVVAIVGILIALLLPAVQAAREAARRATCFNNLKQLGLAFQNHHDSRGGLPASRSTTPAGHGWAVDLLPYLEGSSLHEAYDFEKHYYDPANQTVVLTFEPLFLCPSTPNRERLVRLASGNMGVWIEPEIYGAAGDYFVHHMNISKPDGTSAAPPLAAFNSLTPFRKIVDGLSKTFVANELSARPDRYVQGRPTGEYVSQKGWAAWAGYQSMPLKAYTADATASGWDCIINCSNDSSVYGFHPGGATFLFLDGSAHFLLDATDVELVLALGTMNGGEQVVVP